MPEYYDPRLDLSSPEKFITMGVIVSLNDPVDGEILRSVIEELRVRFPYFYVRAACEGSDVITVPNVLPMTVRNTWEPIRLNSKESNDHLAAWKYVDQRLAFEIPHDLTDGTGVLPYVKSAMFLYLSRSTGKTFDPAGFRLPGDVIPESETGDPFRDLNVNGAEAPLYKKDPVPDFFRLVKGMESDKRVFYLKLPEEQVMTYCRDNFDIPQASICVSYVKGRSFGPLDPYIKEMYVVTSLSEITDILCEVTCINHSFFLAFMQPFSSTEYLACFLKELSLAEIPHEVLFSEPLRMSGI